MQSFPMLANHRSSNAMFAMYRSSLMLIMILKIVQHDPESPYVCQFGPWQISVCSTCKEPGLEKEKCPAPFLHLVKLSLSETLADFIIISKPRFVKTLLTLRARWGVGQLVLRRSTVPDESTF